MGTISVTLPADLEAELNDYDNRSEFVREAVREKLDGEDGDADDTDDWDPEPAELRAGETRDDRSHAARNAEQLKMADDTGGDESDA